MNVWETEVGTEFITPRGDKYPENLEFALFLRETFEDMHVADVGCGMGRLSPLFQSIHYTGYDINQHAIDLARKLHPRRAFATMPKLVQREGVLFHTVLQHLPGLKVREMLDRILCDKLVISEIMSPQLRNTSLKPYSYNRAPVEYIDMAAAAGMSLASQNTFTYGNDRYGPDHKLNALVFVR